VNIGPVSVRYRRGKFTEEPHMGVRVMCAREHFTLIKADLERRGASVIDTEINHQVSVVRATAPLAALIGYPDRLYVLTRGSGRHVMWLSHYAPTSTSLGNRAAVRFGDHGQVS
jgi:translation elongation factor EF-G